MRPPCRFRLPLVPVANLMESVMHPDDFEPDLAVAAFNQSIDQITRFFADAEHRPAADLEDLVLRQIVENVPIETPLFRLFCKNATNRSGGVNLQGKDLDALADSFAQWDPQSFSQSYPLTKSSPSSKLRQDFIGFSQDNNILKKI